VLIVAQEERHRQTDEALMLFWRRRQGMTEVHSFDLAMEVFRRIGEAYPVTVREMGKEP
jgi:hypothetical protein